MKKLISLFTLLITILIITACPNSAVTAKEEMTEQAFIYYTMKDVYLWNKDLPELDYNSYPSAEAVLEAMRNKQYDRWSYIVRRESSGSSSLPDNMQYNDRYGYGFDVDWEGNQLIVRYVKLGSPPQKSGIKRGDRILAVGTTVIPAQPTAEFKSSIFAEIYRPTSISLKLEGRTEAVTLTKGVYKVQHILVNRVIPHAGKKVGYLVFNSFDYTGNAGDKDDSNDNIGLDNAFKSFSLQGVTELVLDLRYNGGGSVAVSNHLANLIAGAQADGALYKKLYFNGRNFTTSNVDVSLALLDYFFLNSDYYRFDYMPEAGYSSYYFKRHNYSLNLKRVFVITTDNTASASESVINGLKPYLDVKLIGSQSHGKPVGMIPLNFRDIEFVPIMFRGENALGAGDFYDGIPADKAVADDFSKELGDSTEACLQEALYYIENERFSTTP